MPRTDRFPQIYEKIVEEFPDPYFGGLARLKGAMLAFDNASTAQLQERLAPILADDSVWRYSARELLAYSLFRDADFKGARDAFDRLRSDLAVPEGLRTRAEQMVAQIDLRLAGVHRARWSSPALPRPKRYWKRPQTGPPQAQNFGHADTKHSPHSRDSAPWQARPRTS